MTNYRVRSQTNYRVRKLVAGLAALLALGGTIAVTAAPAEAAPSHHSQTNYGVNGI